MRLEKDGLCYEADPRHIDLIAESSNITDANSVCSPGMKNPDPDIGPQSKAEDAPEKVDADNDDSNSRAEIKTLAGQRPEGCLDCGWGDVQNLQ